MGIGFAIPINTVRNVAAQIITSGHAEHALLGVSTFPLTAQLAQLFKLPTEQGMLVQTIQKGSGADKAGLKAGKTKVIVGGVSYAIGGDIIVKVDGASTTTYEQLRDAISEKKPGDKIKLEIYRDGSKKTVTVTLGKDTR